MAVHGYDYYLRKCYLYNVMAKLKPSLFTPGQALRVPVFWLSQISRLSAQKVVSASDLGTGSFYPHVNIAGTHFSCGPGSSVGKATDYGMDGLGSNPGGDEIFRPSRPALGTTQSPVQWVMGLCRGKVWPGRDADHSQPSSARVMEE